MRGSSYIVELELRSYFNWDKQEDFSEFLKEFSLELPFFLSGEIEKAHKYFVSEARPVPDGFLVFHDIMARHLSAFENTVRNLMTATDFCGGGTLFVNILGFQELARGISTDRFAAGHSYRLLVYHYQDRHSPAYAWRPAWINVYSESPGVSFPAGQLHRVQAEYDEFSFTLSLDADMVGPTAVIGLAIQSGADDEHRVDVMRTNIPFAVDKIWFRYWMKVGAITFGVAGAQIIGLLGQKSFSWSAAAGVVLFSGLAALAAASRLPTKP